ncbi:hypothetical protein FGG36_gp65 [Mycobacterium phage Jeffabunny]|uniref:Uncharacterized protein n=4 Tax=Gladiatorvirus TaxID=2948726 RepID=A0A7G9A1A4_9CAUD|nr:hypothetical protein X820_gp076 [Mycobacterium phage CloudWang3]YP_008858463.1 hypothetical protein X828_gp075 [Mycobacterium phage Artemis2UCLA]YP_009303585.1 hypothetical protein BJD74_gp73 [Mycobacterium phage Mulciber]YP_009638210.1 hypothetical protein FGG36_gp65 [Mycobacterium phage Jeffabunny]ANT42227.1 hypothetical protein SEA_TONETONE_36 [Mycobacterium phage ToneTone]AOT24778.1 hypothetical protein PBI_ISIPHIWO_39 [Mycobacterium phage Isiphiwo]AQT28276.1 hypothetical protein SEA_J
MTRYVVTARLLFSSREDALRAASQIDGHDYARDPQNRIQFDGLMSSETVIEEI